MSAVALILSTAGVYALMAFTVTRRTREIGIRAAVGADRRQILTGIFSRAFGQVGLGVAAGSVPGGCWSPWAPRRLPEGRGRSWRSRRLPASRFHGRCDDARLPRPGTPCAPDSAY